MLGAGPQSGIQGLECQPWSQDATLQVVGAGPSTPLSCLHICLVPLGPVRWLFWEPPLFPSSLSWAMGGGGCVCVCV